MYNQKENGLQGVGAATSSLTTMISIRQQIILADDSAWRKQLNVRGFAALMVAVGLYFPFIFSNFVEPAVVLFL